MGIGSDEYINTSEKVLYREGKNILGSGVAAETEIFEWRRFRMVWIVGGDRRLKERETF